jgi:hypothetical protein
VVVAVGLTLVAPLAEADVNVPGVMAILVAPVAVQLSMLLAPEFMLVGFAAKEVMVGFPDDEFDELTPQAASPTQTASRTMKAQRRVLWLWRHMVSKASLFGASAWL